MKEKNENVDFVEKRAEFILGRLGLKWEDLQGKKILDIGAGPAEIAQVAAKKGIKVFSLDINRPEDSVGDTEYIIADVHHLPLVRESFDLVMAHAAPPALISGGKEEAKKVFYEVARVLKSGGEFRWGPATDAGLFEEGELFSPKEEKIFSTNQRIARVRQKSLDFYESLNENIRLIRKDDDFLVFTKPEK